jgi:hypothetical protein
MGKKFDGAFAPFAMDFEAFDRRKPIAATLKLVNGPQALGMRLVLRPVPMIFSPL